MPVQRIFREIMWRNEGGGGGRGRLYKQSVPRTGDGDMWCGYLVCSLCDDGCRVVHVLHRELERDLRGGRKAGEVSPVERARCLSDVHVA